MPEGRCLPCFFNNSLCDYSCGLFQCKCCKEWFCVIHIDTVFDEGRGICAACESEHMTG